MSVNFNFLTLKAKEKRYLTFCLTGSALKRCVAPPKPAPFRPTSEVSSLLMVVALEKGSARLSDGLRRPAGAETVEEEEAIASGRLLNTPTSGRGQWAAAESSSGTSSSMVCSELFCNQGAGGR